MGVANGNSFRPSKSAFKMRVVREELGMGVGAVAWAE